MKKIFSLMLVFGLLFSITASAVNNFSIKPSDEFYIYGKDNFKLAEILGVTEQELDTLCNDKTVYLAVNKTNTKQIRITKTQNEFTSSVINISSFSNDKILSLAEQIIGIEGVKGEVVNKSGQKFIKTELRTADNGGEYILTEYITVADKHSLVLSFYTDINEDTDYVSTAFESFSSDSFVKSEEKQNRSILDFVLPVFTVIFGIATVLIAVSIIIEFRKTKKLK